MPMLPTTILCPILHHHPTPFPSMPSLILPSMNLIRASRLVLSVSVAGSDNLIGCSIATVVVGQLWWGTYLLLLIRGRKKPLLLLKIKAVVVFDFINNLFSFFFVENANFNISYILFFKRDTGRA